MIDFTRELSSDIQERSSAIFIIERVFFTNLYSMIDAHRDVVLLHTIPMLYSIWEGFIQSSFGLYIDYLNRQSITHYQLSKPILLSYTEKKFRQFKEYPSDKTKRITFIDKLSSFFGETQINIPRNVNTESNVGFDVLNNLLGAYSLESFPERYDRYNHPNPCLKDVLNDFLNERNNIAHGGNISSHNRITQETFEKYKQLVLFLMYKVEHRFIDGINNSSHMRCLT